jgi:hypothetical protein
MDAGRGEDTRGQVVNFFNQFRSRLSLVRVDAIGVGHNLALHLRDCCFPVEPVNVGMPCESNPRLGEDDPARRFVNLRAEFYQALADAFERDQVEGLTDETSIGQLAGLLYELDSQGRTKIQSKEGARTRSSLPRPRRRADAGPLQAVPEVRILLAPPSSPSIFGLVEESIEIGASARDLRSRMDAESASQVAIRRNQAKVIRGRFCWVHLQDGRDEAEFMAGEM